MSLNQVVVFRTEQTFSVQTFYWRFLIKSQFWKQLCHLTQEVYHTTSLDEFSIEFGFEIDCNLYLEKRDTHLSFKLKLLKGR